ncbi:Putative E3 ubiquitin-protein ligase XBAT31 [Linum perenne]
MGQQLSCVSNQEHGELFAAVQFGELDIVKIMLDRDPSLIHQTTVYDRQSPLHIAAANGQIEVGNFFISPDSGSEWVVFDLWGANILELGADFVHDFGAIRGSGCCESSQAGKIWYWDSQVGECASQL